jgi:rhodanese-related sulfurtransferase
MERSIKPADLRATLDSTLVLDVRRKADFDASNEAVPGSLWKDPEAIDRWIGALPRNHDVVIYCVRGGSVSNSLLDRLQAEGIRARYIEGWKAAAGKVAGKGM